MAKERGSGRSSGRTSTSLTINEIQQPSRTEPHHPQPIRPLLSLLPLLLTPDLLPLSVTPSSQDPLDDPFSSVRHRDSQELLDHLLEHDRTLPGGPSLRLGCSSADKPFVEEGGDGVDVNLVEGRFLLARCQWISR
jgi:hypothetical protein